MSPLGLYYNTIDIIDEFLSNLKHLNGMVHVMTTVSKKKSMEAQSQYMLEQEKVVQSQCVTLH